MNPERPQDELFARNLRTVASKLSPPEGPTGDVIERCTGCFQETTTPRWRMTVQTYRKPILWSTMGMAAMLALFVTSLWPNANPKVQAALVVSKLAQQAQQNPSMHITIESLAVEEVQCTAHLQLGKGGVAGDVSVRVEHTGDDMPGTIEVDASLGLGAESGWILIRRLSIPDPQAQFFVNMLFPPGSETLLVLPEGSEIGDEVGGEIAEVLEALRSGELIDAFKEMIASAAEIGATVTNQPDGTVRLSLPIEDEEALEALAKVFHKLDDGEDTQVVIEKKINAKSKGSKTHVHKAVEHHHGKHVDHDAKMLVGATVNAVYDPTTETVRMLEVLGLGSPNAVVRLELGEGDVDAALLDSSRVAGPGVRTLDLSAIESMIKSFEGMGDKE
jgi:hypothetical protein